MKGKKKNPVETNAADKTGPVTLSESLWVHSQTSVNRFTLRQLEIAEK